MGAAAKSPETPTQVRLSAEEKAALRETMRILHLRSTSEALREGLRLLHREARETSVARQIAEFYGEEGATAPDGSTLPTQEELDAVDRAEW